MISDPFGKCRRFVTGIVRKAANPVIEKTLTPPTVLSVEETIAQATEHGCSMARFGDGELLVMIGGSTGFQAYAPELAQRLREILRTEERGLLTCLPDVFAGLEKYRAETQAYWRAHLRTHRIDWYRLLDRRRVYYNTFVTRCYYVWADKSQSASWFRRIKDIWRERDVVLVEGEKTRMGLGNDLFEQSRSLSRILAPAENAFSRYGEILSEVRKQPPEKLILLALGPCATVLAYDLHKSGYQALDIGHLDIEYEWFLQRAGGKMRVENKYVNEVPGGNQVSDINDPVYSAQILCRIL